MRRNRVLVVVLSLIATTLGIGTSQAFAAAPVFRGASSVNVNSQSPSVTLPSEVQAGDQLVMVVSTNTDTTIATPAGWTLLGTEQDGRTITSPNMTSAVFTRTADGVAAGATVEMALGTISKTAITVAAYADAQPASSATATTIGSASDTLSTPALVAGQDDTILIDYWVDKGANTGWTVEGVDVRATSIGSGGGRVTALMADRVVAAGPVDGVTATTTDIGTKGIAWTIELAPVGVVQATPTAAVTGDCVNLTCSFDAGASFDADGTIVRFDWNFGDGTSMPDAGPTPEHVYAAADDFTVTVTVTDDDGLDDDASVTVTTTNDGPNATPVASFTVGCTFLSCTFDAAASSDADGSVVDYTWDFGDGASGADVVDPTHIYASAGDYTVTLTVTDNEGAVSPPAQLVAQPSAPPTGTAPAFRGSSSNNLNSLSPSVTVPNEVQPGDQMVLIVSTNTTASIDTPTGWDLLGYEVDGRTATTPNMSSAVFGATADGGSAGSTVTVDLGGYSKTALTLVAYSGVLPAETATATTIGASSASLTTAPQSVAQDGTVVLSAWADKGSNTGWTAPADVDVRATSIGSGGGRVTSLVGDRIASAGELPGATAVSTSSGTKGIAWTIALAPILVENVPPTASFTVDCTFLSCEFDASGSVDPDGSVDSYSWDLGDGTLLPAGDVVQSHAYVAAGEYDVSLVVTDDDGAVSEVAESVASAVENVAPVAALAPGTCVDLTCSFDASASTDSVGSIVSYDWDYGDGTVETDAGPTPEHVYATADTFTVTVTVVDDGGLQDQASVDVTTTEPVNVPPTASFTSDCVDLSCTFNAAASFEPNGTIVTYDWIFNGTSMTDAGPTPEFAFLFGGDYDVELTVTDDDGEQDTLVSTITVIAPALPAQLLPPDVPRRNVPVISTGEITDLELIGNRVYIVGSFGSIRNNLPGNNTTVNQRWVAAYNIDTGLVDTNFRPTFDRSVTEITRSPDGSRLYVVGRFNTVNGITRRKIAAIDPVTGATITSFSANANSAATSVAATESTVYVGGQFTTVRNTERLGLAAVDAITGQLDTSFVNNLSGGIGVDGQLTVQAMDLTPDGDKLLVVHTGRQINGQDRYGMALIDTQTNDLLPWRSRLWDDNLARVGGVTRIYTGSIAPNGEYFVVGSGSGGDRPPISDTAVAYPIEGGDFVEPLWISRMFDSIYSIDISDDAVFVGGHMNYVESQTAPDPWPGLDNTGYGRGQGLAGYGLGDDIVIRQHIAAVDPANGKAIEWNPGSNSYEGNKAMLWTERGLITGGDAITQGGYNVGRVAFYDLDDLNNVGQTETKILSPIEGRVEKSDQPFVIGGTATATSGVQRVQIEVIDGNQYLQDDLTTWGGWNAIVVSDLSSPGATSTEWAQYLTVSGNRQIRVLARAYGNNGTSDPVKDIQRFETFGLDDETPTTRISEPRGTVPTLDFTVTGTATDDVGVSAIRISLRDGQDRYIQDDGSVSPAYNTFTTQPDVIGAVNATWSYEVTVPYEGEWSMQAIAVDTAGQSDLRSADRTWIVSSTAIRPEVAITSPVLVNPPFDEVHVVAPGAPLTLSGIATDDEGLRDVEIRIRNRITDENLDRAGLWGIGLNRGWHRISPVDISGTSYNWTYTTPFTLEQGRYEFEIRATDDLGLTTSGTFEAELDVDVEIEGDSPPDARLDVTGTITDLDVLQLSLTGTATDDFGVADLQFEFRDLDTGLYLLADGTTGGARTRLPVTAIEPADPENPTDLTSVTFRIDVELPNEGDWYVEVYAYDTSGQIDTSQTGATARYQLFPGDTAPIVSLLSPPAGTVFNDARLIVTGRVEDDRQIAGAQVAIQNSDGLYMSSSGAFTSGSPNWRGAFLTSPGSPGSNFSYTSPPIPDGDYTIYARGYDQRGAVTEVPRTTTATVTSPPNDPPVAADFGISCDENVCTFDGRDSTDEDVATLSYSWSFGNGSGSGPLPTRTYTAEGTYTVTLTVTDFYGVSSEVVSKDIVISTPVGNQAPTPVIAAASCTLLRCNFSSLGTAEPDAGDSYSLSWDFGDTTTSTSSYPSHTFDAPGIYTVTLTATDGWGAAASVDVVVDVSVPVGNVAPTPVADPTVCTQLSCQFSSSGSFDSNAGDTFTVLWDFGDGVTSGLAAPVHVYAAPGTKTVSLMATDVWGASQTIFFDVVVTE